VISFSSPTQRREAGVGRFLIGVSASSALFWAGTAEPAWGTDPVSLRFSWPDRVELQVERSFERQEIREPAEAPAPVRSATRFRWTGRRSDDRYRVAFSDFSVVRAEPEPASADALVQLEHVSRAVEPLLPTLVLDREGQPVDLEGLPELRRQLIARYESIPGIESHPQAGNALRLLTSDQVLAQRALEDWNRMVQVWHGVDSEVGHSQEISGTTEGAGLPVDNVFSYALESRVPCDPAASATSCIRLVITQVPRFEDARSAAQMLLGFDFVTALGAPATSTFELRNVFTTDTRPESLLPSRYVKEKRWSVRWQDSEGKHERGRIDRWTYVFSASASGARPADDRSGD